jgi:hypothetical protein
MVHFYTKIQIRVFLESLGGETFGKFYFRLEYFAGI